MLIPRPSAARGGFDFGWLKTRHTFSFGDYHDRNWMGFRSLRVINEDRVAPHTGFGEHGHRDMEIITVMLSGVLTHGDSLKNRQTLQVGEIQRMTAGKGILHSEMNEGDEPVHLLQIWIQPGEKGLAPDYEQMVFPQMGEAGFHPLVSGRGRQGTLVMHQNAELFRAVLAAGGELVHKLEPERHGWVQVIKGPLRVNGELFQAGDGIGLGGEDRIHLSADGEADALVFDLS